MHLNRFGFTTILLISLLVQVKPISADAQDTTNTLGSVSIASPTAASLGKFGDIPVSYHTGIPDISVPIYTVQSGSVKLPIGLSYHAGGLKVAEPAGWVGAGWALNAGGVITRTVVGAPDDRGNNVGASIVTNGYYSDFGFESYLNASGTSIPDDNGFYRGYKDGEPDLFFFNFGGYTGKFYFNDDRTPILMPEGDLKIVPSFSVGPGFTGFLVTTPDGTKYYFGQTGNYDPVIPIEVTTSATTQNGYSTANDATSSWFLNKVVSADGMDSITLSYTPENYSYYTYSTSPVINSIYLPSASDSRYVGYNVVKNFVSGVRLTQINSSNGIVAFNPSASPRTDLSVGSDSVTTFTDIPNTKAYSLGSITISDNEYLCKTYQFNYSYWYDNSSLPGSNFLSYCSTYNLTSDKYRLRLDSLQEFTCDTAITIPPYRFTYFTETVPRRLSFGADHWGYANGVTNNTTLVPTFTVATSGQTPVVTTGASRDAVWPAMRAGSLQQITYPTGGSTSFDFESKAVYTFDDDILENVPMLSLVCNLYGQSQLSDTQNFTVQDDGYAVNVTVATNINGATLIIKNSSNVEVFGQVLSNTTPFNITLDPGTYTATLSIVNNTGGADITFNQYQYVNVPHSQAVGGLRIKTITHTDALTAIPNITSYTYLDNDALTNDVLYSVPTYVQTIRNDLLKLVWPYASANGCASVDGFGGQSYFISGGSLRPMATAQGENVGYREVDVTQSGNGHSVYRYYGALTTGGELSDVCVRILYQSGVCDASIPNFPAPPVPFDPMRDELAYEGHYNQAGHILKDVTYTPSYLPSAMITPGHVTVNVLGLYSYTEYNLQSQRKVQDVAVQTLYDPVNSSYASTTTTTYYNSPWHHQPTRSVTTTSTGDSLAKNIKYAMDFRVPSCDAVTDSLAIYNTTMASDTGWIMEKIDTCSPQENSTNNCRWIAWTNFREMQMQARKSLIAWRRRNYANDSTGAVSTCYLSAQASADTLLQPVLTLQTLNENMSIETTDWKDLNLRHAAFTVYNASTSPTGFAYPGRMQLINLQAQSSSFTSSAVSSNTISKDTRYLDESYYQYANGRPQQTTSHDGITTSYIWDYGNQHPVAKVVNASVNEIAYCSFEADGSGGWSIAYPYYHGPGTGITGDYIFDLSYGPCWHSGLDPSKTYIVSYWTYTDEVQTVSGTTKVTMGKFSQYGWQYIEHTLTGVSTVEVSGDGPIDELRLYPANAQMTTYTYSPSIGITSQCDVNNRITYYYYDFLGRLQTVKDQDGNIIKTYDYHYMGSTTPAY